MTMMSRSVFRFLAATALAASVAIPAGAQSVVHALAAVTR